MPAYGSEDDIEKLISGLNQTLHSGNSWYNVGFFDFAYDIELDSFIEHFDIHVRNFSPSYAVIEMKVTLSDSLCNEISDFIQTQYKKPGMCVHENWTKCMDSICPLLNAYIYQLQQYDGVIHPRQI